MIGVVNQGGSVVLVGPDEHDLLAFADWCAEHVAGEPVFWGDALVVEPRYVADLVDGLSAAGFEVEI